MFARIQRLQRQFPVAAGFVHDHDGFDLRVRQQLRIIPDGGDAERFRAAPAALFLQVAHLNEPEAGRFHYFGCPVVPHPEPDHAEAHRVVRPRADRRCGVERRLLLLRSCGRGGPGAVDRIEHPSARFDV